MEEKGYTQDGTVNLRRQPVLSSKTGKWKACAFLVGYEAFERMAFYGVASNLVVYLTTQLHEDTVASVRNVNNWSGAVWMTPIFGAYIADSYLGRFWTFTFSSLIYVLGMVLLTLAVSIKFLKPTCSNGVCNKASTSQIAFFYTSLYIIAIGAGGTKPNISTFGADQFDDFDPDEKRLKVSFFNWWMFSSFLGALVATLGLVYIQENLGWGLGYGIPTVGLILSLLIFYMGTPMYRHKVRKTKSPAADFIRVVKAAFANRQRDLPSDPKELHEFPLQHYVDSGKRQVYHTPIFRFLDKGALKEEDKVGNSKRPPCTITQVEGVKLVLGMGMIWLVTLIPSTIWAQVNTLFVKQGTTLDRHLGSTFQLPAASLGSFVTLSMLISVPMYDRYFVPLMRKRTKNPRGITMLQRLGIGFSIQILAIAMAYLVEVKRMQCIKSHNILNPKEVIPMTIFWLLPQYILLGVADVFNAIGLLEFFYDQSPEDMQSLGTTFFTSGIGVGNFLNSFLVTMVDKATSMDGRKSWIGNNLNDSHLDYYYGFLLLISILNLGAFLWASKKYIYKRESNVEAKNEILEMECKPLEVVPLGLQV
ncbi:putative proton-dependent oligopeptide transporter family, major facilitator superfamily [Helianthus annuus]|uniref:Proton-dependent oligopeptide transporter family, major facilitator superfamily n=1 Tax=Helianthus annuus TaxID=4232 RepID=A0A251UDF4_HELAN|nr:protein NRT1/ PTR FAMILY 5.1 [Helianthus annuus]KAF5800200.1 putative proton-dependent oligopeptide transporter family, major facilitator superfamily [Helianthus annuus]KAJ0558627.1 putative proton-dependent oligopeptide transporter family, MFS transporter superfamily [Helianthus annuus]KAJ0564533.1 putative proton-dependent oligopeptide transporter family, MFS transporter superfamily [Helianthus annuus]